MIPVSEPVTLEFEISNPGTTSRSVSLHRNAAKCDLRFSTLPGEIVQLQECVGACKVEAQHSKSDCVRPRERTVM